MPANIAHLLICNKSVKALEDGGGYEEFVRILDSDECKPYLNLGSTMLGSVFFFHSSLARFDEILYISVHSKCK